MMMMHLLLLLAPFVFLINICNIVVGFICGLLMMVLVLVLVMVSGVKVLAVIDASVYGVNFGG